MRVVLRQSTPVAINKAEVAKTMGKIVLHLAVRYLVFRGIWAAIEYGHKVNAEIDQASAQLKSALADRGLREAGLAGFDSDLEALEIDDAELKLLQDPMSF